MQLMQSQVMRDFRTINFIIPQGGDKVEGNQEGEGAADVLWVGINVGSLGPLYFP